LKTTFDKFNPNNENVLTYEGAHKALVEMTDDEIDTNDVKRMMMGLLSTLNFEVFGPTLDGITFTSIEDFIKHDIFRTTQQI